MNAVDLGVNLFVTLFALLDPIGNLPIFAAATAGATLRQRISVSALICAFAAVFLAFFLFTGLGLLQFFGISLAAFRIAGGILLLFLGLDMARGDFLAMFADKDALADSKDVRGYARRRFRRSSSRPARRPSWAMPGPWARWSRSRRPAPSPSSVSP